MMPSRLEEKSVFWIRSLGAIAGGVLVLFALSCKHARQEPTETNSKSANSETVRQLVATEELIIELGKKLNPLSGYFEQGWVTNAPLPHTLFADSTRIKGLQTPLNQPSNLLLHRMQVKSFEWGIARATVETSATELSIWQSLRPHISNMRRAQFFIIDGDFLNRERSLFECRVGFTGAGQSGDQEKSIEADQVVIWEREKDDWRIVSWEQTSFRTMESSQLLFKNVVDEIFRKEQDRRRARLSRHHEILVDSYFGNKPARTPKGYTDTRFFPDSVNIHPSVSVVDIDRDGWDDLYVCVRWGKNMLFRNQGDGSFEESAAEYKLDIEGRSTSATFADFDNDGDPDLMLGRSLERSQYFVNDQGRFVNASESHIDGQLPFLVTSTSAADFNGDGLLDVYFSTYSPLDITSRIQGRADTTPGWAKRFLAADEAAEVNRRYADYHGFLGQVGPPNSLFVNRGNGRFELAAESSMICGYRNTFQATWCDFDNDRDPDLYVANDFAPDHLYRNDGSNGFVDISADSGTRRMGFGMGAAWGDYDNDGHFDLYVSNMYSKAGQRITARVPGLDSRMVAGSEGNYLFRNLADARFDRVSGLHAPDLTVAKAGWSWGGQFADFDNNGFLDLYVSSGFYTPPQELGNGVDL